MIPAIEYTNGRDVIAAAAALRARIMPVPPRPTKVAVPKAKPIFHANAVRAPLYWEIAPTDFNQHVIAYRQEMLRRERDEEGEGPAGKPSIRSIVLQVLARHPGISMEAVRGETRERRVVAARQEAMWEVRMARDDLSFPMVGRWFGGRDHTTVLHAVRKIAEIKAKERGE